MEARKTLWRNARLATCAGVGLGVIERGALVTQGGRILFAGPEAEAPGADRDRRLRRPLDHPGLD